MAEDFVNDTTTNDLDLNLEPLDSSPGSSIQLWSLIDELESAHGQIEERIRQLEAVTTRALQRQRRQRQSTLEMAPPQVTDPPVNSQQEGVDRDKNGKRGRTCLVAEALGINTVTRSSAGDGGGFFDCNICFDMAKDPILTCCGHLFCWPCFHQLPYVYSTAKECPICKGEVAENKIVPIYGNGGDHEAINLGFGSRIPPRPKANRIERVSHIPVSAALRRIRMGIDAHRSPVAPVRHLPNMTTLTEGAATVSSISSAIDSAERLVEDLESYVRNRILRRTDSVTIFPENPVNSSVGTEPSDEEQLARRITNAGTVSFNRSGVGLRVTPNVSNEENETSHEVQRRRLI